MKRKKIVCCLVMLNLLLGMCVAVSTLYAGEVRLDNKINEYAEVLNELMDVPESRIPHKLMRKCEAIVIFPSVVKAGFIIGGEGRQRSRGGT